MQRTMKKIYTLAALAMVAIVACNKEIETSIEILPTDKGEVSIVAQAPAETKTTIDGLQVKWATGDHIAVIDEDNGAHDFTLDDGAGTTTGVFSGSLAGKESGGIAIYPYSGNAAYNGTNITVDYPATYAYNAVTVPMWGEEGTGENVGKYTFNHIGGAFKIQYTNVPHNAASFVFTATSSITGTASYNFSTATLTSNTGSVVTVTDLPDEDELTFFIPVPAGSYSFDVKLLDSGDNVIAGSEKTVTSAKDVAVGHVAPLRAIAIPAPQGTVLWSEDFTGCSDGTQPDEGTSTLYGGGYASYSYGGGTYTKVYAAGSLNGSPEMLIAKSSRSETWTVSGIPTAGWSTFTLTYNANQSISVKYGGESVTDVSNEGNNWVKTITVSGSASSFSLVFSMSTDNNARLDNIVLTAGAPVAGVSVTTSEATLTESAEGTTATINGSLSAINGGDLANVTAAGFYYKKTESAGAYNRVTVTPGASINKALTGLETNKEYTFYAFAIYNDGDEVYGEPLTFTPTVGVSYNTYTYTFTSKAWTATLNEVTANWTSGKDGNALTSGRGIQITTGVSGANATSPVSFTGVKQIIVTYSTNASAGAGKISVKVGTNDAIENTITKTGGTTDRTTTFDISPEQSGTVLLTATCTTNSIYVKSVSITARSAE